MSETTPWRSDAPVEPDFRRVFHAQPAACVVLAPDLTIVAASDAYLAMTMQSRAELLGRDLFEAFPCRPGRWGEDEREHVRHSLDRVRRDCVRDATAIWEYDVPRPAEAGGGLEERFWSSVSEPLLDASGKLTGIAHFIDDVTDVVRLTRRYNEHLGWSEELEAQRARMEAKVVAHAAELEQTNRRLVEADQAKSEFLSRMSHELRTPLNSILGFSELLARELTGAEELDSVHHIVAAGRHLLELINEVLDIAKIEARHLDLAMEPLAVGEVAREAVELMAPVARARAVRLDAGAPGAAHVRADRGRLRQVLLNLLSNAVKYNRENGSVTLRYDEVGDHRLRIAITDTGPGIAPEHFAAVFTPFERLSAERGEVEGAGIGLALSKRLVEAMGGSIGFMSAPGAGSTFFVDLDRVEPSLAPLAPLAAGALAAGSGALAAVEGNVLYIEDNPANQALVERILAAAPGLELRCAALGRDGLALARERPPDLILLDLHLPDLHGAEVVRALRRDPRTARVPVVVLSADAIARHSDDLVDLGVHAYLTKPLDIAALEAVVGGLVAPGVRVGA